jgi:hypothetical protein
MAEAILTLSEALERANRGEPIVPATPKHLKRWTRPSCYIGAGRSTTPQAWANPAIAIV